MLSSIKDRIKQLAQSAVAIEFAVEYMNSLEDKNTGEIYG